MASPPRPVWRGFIKPSRSIPVYHDALSLICKKLEDRGKAIPKPLDKWQRGVADGSRERPDRKPLRRGRPANPAQLFRDIHMAFTIEILERLGVPPRGKFNRFSIVAEALGMSEKQVKRTWNARPWETPVVAQGAGIHEGHRQTPRARLDSLRREPRQGFDLSHLPPCGNGRLSQFASPMGLSLVMG